MDWPLSARDFLSGVAIGIGLVAPFFDIGELREFGPPTPLVWGAIALVNALIWCVRRRIADVPVIRPTERNPENSMKASNILGITFVAIGWLCAAPPGAAKAAREIIVNGAADAQAERSTAGEWLRSVQRAAENGDRDAMNDLGLIHLYGGADAKDYAAARYWLDAAIARGSIEAMNSLAHLYFHGFGVPRNFAVAAAWFRTAAEAGNATSLHNLAVMAELGLGLVASQGAAQEFYGAAAARGSIQSMLMLGERYEIGRGVAQDLVLAYAWTATGLSRGLSTSVAAPELRRLAEISVRLSDRELRQAQALTTRFSELLRNRATSGTTVPVSFETK
jgi:uncharacterized protein